MTPVQQEATARAEAKMRDGKVLYACRTRLAFLVGKLELRDLERMTGIINRLLAAEPDGALLKRVAAFAEGLAEWCEDASQSPDAAISHR